MAWWVGLSKLETPIEAASYKLGRHSRGDEPTRFMTED